MDKYKYKPKDFPFFNIEIKEKVLNKKLEEIYEQISKLNDSVKEEDIEIRGYKVSAIFSRMTQITRDWPELWTNNQSPVKEVRKIHCPQCGVFILDKVGENGLYCTFCSKFVIFQDFTPSYGYLSCRVRVDGDVMYVTAH